MFVKHGCPRWQQNQKYGKISKSQILTPSHPQGHVMSVKCEQPLDELTVQVWLLNDHPNFKYCTLNVSRMELRTDRQTDGWTIQHTRCPRWTFQAGGKKIVAAFLGMHVSPAKHSYGWLPDRHTSDKVIPLAALLHRRHKKLRKIKHVTRHVFVKHRCPRAATKLKYGKNL